MPSSWRFLKATIATRSPGRSAAMKALAASRINPRSSRVEPEVSSSKSDLERRFCRGEVCQTSAPCRLPKPRSFRVSIRRAAVHFYPSRLRAQRRAGSRRGRRRLRQLPQRECSSCCELLELPFELLWELPWPTVRGRCCLFGCGSWLAAVAANTSDSDKPTIKLWMPNRILLSRLEQCWGDATIAAKTQREKRGKGIVWNEQVLTSSLLFLTMAVRRDAVISN